MLLHRKDIYILCCLLVGLSSLAAEERAESWQIREETLGVVTPMRVKTITEKSEKINNPVRWQPLKTIVADGLKVRKDDILATFVSTQAEYDLNTLLLQQKVIDANLQRRLASIDNKNLDMSDSMGVLEDKLASLKSKLDRQKSEPTEDDIRIVEGRLRIAQMNLAAARKDYEKDKGRFERQMISRAELDSSEKSLHEKEAKELFARQELEATKNPPKRVGDIASTEIDIESAKLEIEKLAFEIQEQLKISEIQRKGAVVNKERNDREIKEKREDIEKVIVRAPIPGFLSVNKFDNNEIVPGTRMWPNYTFMEIPDLETIGFKGILLESRRQYHAEGDRVVLYLNGRKGGPVEGTVKSISTLSHDLSEKDDAGWNRDRKFGVKVFDVVVQLSSPVDWLRPGMIGTAEIVAKKELKGPVVPLKFVKEQEGKYYLSFGGEFREVTGMRVGADFLLDDHSLVGKTVTLGGHLTLEKKEDGEEEHRLSASGELLPVRSTNIQVGKIGRWPWPKITWLIPEESMVKKGDKVATLDPKEREKQVRKQEETVTEYRSSRDELEKKVEITRRNSDFKLKVAEFKLESTKIATAQTLNIVTPIPVYRAEMNLKLAEIKLADQQRKVDREVAKKTPTVSPAELRKMKRELLRSKLKVEQASLNLETAREGSTEIQKSKARLNLAEAEDNLETTKKQIIYDNLAIRREYERSKISLARVERRLEFRKEQVANHTIYAPEDGLLCYNKVYNNGAITKVAVGNTVGPRFSILSIPDLSEMELKVEVEEKYFSQIHDGMEVEVRLPSLSDRRLSGTVNGIDLLFTNRAKKDSQIGLYSSHEPLGEVIFCVRIRIRPGDVQLKPGLIGEVYFPIAK